ncbi:hypothetical protein [Alkalitalea saponilacus]|uniref:Uncharacterized protein n=1 Tax=Alkalitalea saponilacus TaxID=889453 RepID=A0A1T5HUX2_9BACT|nr:hypothetical protein [Alkalitalea saponilacus]SKC24330.1 hypothetical protein SAMN03080601_03633 [Alkalitalea saponilacus]
MKKEHLLIELSETDLSKIDGGLDPVTVFVLGVAAGYVFGEIMEGIYQFRKNGCCC